MSRKMDHVEHALGIGQSGRHGFDDITFVHQCIIDLSMDEVKLDTSLGTIAIEAPIYINAMTGGSTETEQINRELAIAAAQARIPMAVGSQMSALKHAEVEQSYRIVREMNPNGIVLANLGSEATVDQALRAIDMLEANMLQIHLNIMQELIMPEGDRNFSGMLGRIESIVKASPVPVMVKEVGFGIMREGARKLRDAGVSVIDCGGSGGTNFAAIENARREQAMPWLNGWGHPTAIALLESLSVYPRGSVTATGGISGVLEAGKALALGASAVGMAGAFLRVLRSEGLDALVALIEQTKQELKLLMTALGARSVPELWDKPLVITGPVERWCRQRGINTVDFARRGEG
ncbi:type 2 isopentenyl-diphosphate Delta-isomerase [Paenibacillus turpanensis]|uniref:type 2 isopentenyl-diphosphate Delta-isomerase n=1 Tax=Paenibacillus turpanensis TaxID=2689078 RepID=UPI001FB79566|nr:type 2 isopentenyl-diphosphate Delta-isomerase [Paenibacillus turpanensis]